MDKLHDEDMDFVTGGTGFDVQDGGVVYIDPLDHDIPDPPHDSNGGDGTDEDDSDIISKILRGQWP